MDSAAGYICSISQTASVPPLGVAHFYDAFSIDRELDLRTDALRAFALPETAISSDLSRPTQGRKVMVARRKTMTIRMTKVQGLQTNERQRHRPSKTC